MKTKMIGPFLLIGLLLATSAAAAPLQIWISSFQDKVYYEDMIRLYQTSADPKFEGAVTAYGFREMPDKFAVAIKTGANPPDIVQLDEVLFGMYLGGVVPFVDLADKVKAAGLDKDLVPQRLKLFSQGTKVYGVPQSLSAILLYYRTDLFEKHDITPADLTTWEEFEAVGKRLKEKNQAMIGIDPSYFEILLRQRGSDLFGPDGKPFPDEGLAIDTLRWMYEMQNKGYAVQPERGSIFDPVFFNTAVSSDAILCILGADWYGLDMIQQFTPQLKGKWGVMPLPAWKDATGKLSRRTSVFAGQGLMIYKESKAADQAWDFIKFVMTHREANVQRFTQGNSFPAHRPSWKDERLLQPSEFFSNQSMGKLLIRLAPEIPEVAMTSQRPQAVFMFQENYFSQLMYGQLTPEETVAQMKAALSR